MEILVTGGTGFLGRHLIRGLLQRGHSVRLMGRDLHAVQDLLRLGAVPVRADLRDHEAVVAACRGVEAAFHAGALSAAWGLRRDFHDINVGGTASVLAGRREHGVRRVVYLSSPAWCSTGATTSCSGRTPLIPAASPRYIPSPRS